MNRDEAEALWHQTIEEMTSMTLTESGYRAALARLKDAIDATPPDQRRMMPAWISSLEEGWERMHRPEREESPTVLAARRAMARGNLARGSLSDRLGQANDAWEEIGRLAEGASREDLRVIGGEAEMLAALIHGLEARARDQGSR